MTPEDQRKALVEACGWRPGDETWMSCLVYWVNEDGDSMLSDPLDDLNCMRQAEKILVAQNRYGDYMNALLSKVCADADEPFNNDTESIWGCFHASAAQRAEAFLKTLKLWKD